MTDTKQHESAVDRIRQRVEEKAARRAAAARPLPHASLPTTRCPSSCPIPSSCPA